MKIPTLRYRKIFLVLSLSCLALAVCGGGRAATVLRPGVYRWTVPASDAGGMIEVEIAGGGGGGASAIVAGSHALLIADDGGGGGGGNNHGEDARGGFGQMLSTFLPIAATVADSRTCSGPCVYAGETLTLTVGAGGTGAKGIHGGIGGMGFGGRGGDGGNRCAVAGQSSGSYGGGSGGGAKNGTNCLGYGGHGGNAFFKGSPTVFKPGFEQAGGKPTGQPGPAVAEVADRGAGRSIPQVRMDQQRPDPALPMEDRAATANPG